MILEKLPTLEHVWSKDPRGSISLPFLEEVVVNGCQRISSLFSASVSKGNLHKLDVRYCDKLVEIVTKDEAAIDETNKELIMFPKLTSLTLHYLPNLTYIYGGLKIINWPELQELDVHHCKLLKKFASDDFQDSPCSYPKDHDYFTTDTNSIDSAVKVVTPLLKRLSVDKEGVVLLEKGVLHFDHKSINYLKLQGFNDIESDAFPLDVFSRVQLSNAEEFAVSNSAFKEIFPSKKPEIIPSELIGLELMDLHSLESIGFEHSWMESLVKKIRSLTVLKCHGLTNLVPSATVLSFSSLTWLKVEGCPSLKYLITSSTAKSLVNLQELYISNCEALESMVDYQPDDDVITFERLEKLSLSMLPKLESFYTPNSTLNFPSLENVVVTECNRLEYLFLFSSTAEILQNLYKMEVSKCESLETVIMATQDADTLFRDLTFVRMKLYLSELPKLGSFFAGNSALVIQHLAEVFISQCKSMETFSCGDVELPKLLRVEIDGVVYRENNLNAIVSQQFENQLKQH